MVEKGNWILLESEGVKEKYLCTETNEIIEAIGTVAVHGDNKVKKYKGIVVWSRKIPIIKQVLAIRKICKDDCTLSNEEILKIAQNTKKWEFGEFLGVEAMSILEMAKQNDLSVEMVEMSDNRLALHS